MKNIARARVGCQPLGQESTRALPAAFSQVKSNEEAWARRLLSGQSGRRKLYDSGNEACPKA